MREPFVYIMTNKPMGTLYAGVTSNLIQRVYQHKEGVIEGFTNKYDCKRLVYFEACETMECAIIREKQIKAGSRKSKIKLIVKMNPHWRDLYNDLW